MIFDNQKQLHSIQTVISSLAQTDVQNWDWCPKPPRMSNALQMIRSFATFYIQTEYPPMAYNSWNQDPHYKNEPFWMYLVNCVYHNVKSRQVGWVQNFALKSWSVLCAGPGVSTTPPASHDFCSISQLHLLQCEIQVFTAVRICWKILRDRPWSQIHTQTM